MPSDVPTVLHSDVPSLEPTAAPSLEPSYVPSVVPSYVPSVSPSNVPSSMPSYAPSDVPSFAPSNAPSVVPSDMPSDAPSDVPSNVPSDVPSNVPTMTPIAVLFVVSDPERLSQQEIMKTDNMTLWGFDVNHISAFANSTVYDSLLSISDVVFVGEEAPPDSEETSYFMLRNRNIGIVLEKAVLASEFDFGFGYGTENTTSVNITDNVHFITQGFGLGLLPIFHNFADLTFLTYNHRPKNVLGRAPGSGKPSLAIFAENDLIFGEFPAPGRRVFLPWGDNGSLFQDLTLDAQIIMRRALRWGAGHGQDHGPPPPNDLCDDAEEIIPGETKIGTNCGATADSSIGECGGTKGVWFKTTGDGDIFTAATCGRGTNFDTQISVFSGSCGTLGCLERNDDSCFLQSRVVWPTNASEEYFILVHGFGTAEGNFELSLERQTFTPSLSPFPIFGFPSPSPSPFFGFPSGAPVPVPVPAPVIVPAPVPAPVVVPVPGPAPSPFPSPFFGFPSGAPFPFRRDLRDLQSETTESNTETLLSAILKSSFQGASGTIEFGKETEKGRNSDTINVGVFNIRPLDTNPATGRRPYEVTLIGVKEEGSSWQNIPNTTLVYRDGTSTPSGVLRRIQHANYMSLGVRITGLVLMSTALLIAVVTIALLVWLRKDPIVQRAQPAFMLILCVGSALMSMAIFTLSFDEGAGWTNKQLSVACSLTPWLFFTGQILVFCALFTKLYRLDKVLQFRRTKVTIYSALWPLLSFIALTFAILAAHSIYDPWSWVRVMISEIPSETYGECTSNHQWIFFGLLTGVLVISELLTMFFAWKTADVPEDFRDSGAVMYACFVQIQAWAIGVPMVAVLGHKSVDATYFAQILLIFLFAISSVMVVVGPKVVKAIRIRRNPSLFETKGRVKVSGLYQPPSSGASTSQAPSFQKDSNAAQTLNTSISTS